MPFLQVSTGEWERMVNGHNHMLNAFNGLAANDWVINRDFYYLNYFSFRLAAYLTVIRRKVLNSGGGEMLSSEVCDVLTWTSATVIHVVLVAHVSTNRTRTGVNASEVSPEETVTMSTNVSAALVCRSKNASTPSAVSNVNVDLATNKSEAIVLMLTNVNETRQFAPKELNASISKAHINVFR